MLPSHRYFAVLIVPLLLCACAAPSSISGVRQLGQDKQFAFVANQNYQPVYRRVLEQMRECYEFGFGLDVRGDLYHDIKGGTITLTGSGPVWHEIYQMVDISAIDERSSKVVAYYATGPMEPRSQILKQWVLEETKNCDLKSPGGKAAKAD